MDNDFSIESSGDTEVTTEIKPPSMFKVTFYNDDFTPMDLVMMILMTNFNKSQEQAQKIMLTVHNKGKEIAGIYPKSIAISKTNKASEMAKDYGYPLRIEASEM